MRKDGLTVNWHYKHWADEAGLSRSRSWKWILGDSNDEGEWNGPRKQKTAHESFTDAKSDKMEWDLHQW